MMLKIMNLITQVSKMSKNKVLIEKFKGFEIYYDKENERFVSDKGKLDIHFEASTLWEIKGKIKQSQTKEVDQEYFIASGYFGKGMAHIKLLTINNITKRCKYKILEDTEHGYDNGNIKGNYETPKLYDCSKHNIDIFNQLKELEKEKSNIESKQKKLVNNLK